MKNEGWITNIPAAVVFQIGQVGEASGAEAFIQGLHNDPEVGHMVHCTSGKFLLFGRLGYPCSNTMIERLDTKIEELKDNDTNMERWVFDDCPPNLLGLIAYIATVA